jgi:(S)-ureidoglycine aminohydrolase
MKPFGMTRTRVQPNHAFIAPDGYVSAALPGWSRSTAVVLISPHMLRLPRFTQYLATLEEGGTSGAPAAGVQRFAYVMEGVVSADIDGHVSTLSAGHYAYLPADLPHTLTAHEAAKLMIFEKPYTPSSVTSAAAHPVTGDAWAAAGAPFLGDEATHLRVLLPTDVPFDMAVNLFTFQPGAALPFVETHIMEHGLYFVEGQGIYRLDDQWYPIQAGDTIWMGSYCPQWFCAIGKTPSTYLYYKDVNRDPLAL